MAAVYIFGVITLYCIVLYVLICHYYKRAPYNNGQKRDAIIVLGCPAREDGSISPALRERSRTAAELYHKGIARTVICSGAAVANDFTEADVLAESLIADGVPDSRIVREKLAGDTFENIVNSKKIMQERDLHTAVIVSSPWHLRKASTFAALLGINHTVEKSRLPREYGKVGAAFITFYVYTTMMIYLKSDYKRVAKSLR